MAGSLNHNELVLFWTISFFSSYAIAVFLRWIVEKTKRESILVLILCIKILISLFALPTLTIIKIIQTGHGLYDFKSPC